VPIRVDIANEQELLSIDESVLRRAVELVLQGENRPQATVSLAIVDDAAIRPLNARYLNHDEATDVLSFVLEDEPNRLEGQIVVSAETAIAAAPQFGQTPLRELLLYAIHGALHLVGYDDRDEADRREMRAREERYLAAIDVPRKQN
jgi:probable rRNA maturation factor